MIKAVILCIALISAIQAEYNGNILKFMEWLFKLIIQNL